MKSIFFTLFILLILVHLSIAQWVEQERITTFSSRNDSPIKIEVMEKDGQYAFYALNRSSYPFELELKVSTVNLQPENFMRKFVVIPGKNHLITLRQKSKDISANYSYTYKYAIGDPNQNPDEDYSYLLPVGEGNKTKLYSYKYDKNIYMKDFFSMNEGDTVYCMRKGYVTATPKMYHSSDRIANSNSLEIRHSDGTIMIYENLKEDLIFTNIGKKVYPGQPIGVVSSQNHLIVQLYCLAGNYKLKRLKIKYYIDDKSIEYSDKLTETEVTYPVVLIQKELSKREIKRLNKGKLF